jgi:anti-sigma-K factor RskA
MNEEQEVLAAEYVLGTLDAEERARAQALVESDLGFAAMVRGWERRFGELQAMVDPVEPSPDLWDRIKAGVGETTPDAPMRLPDVAPARRREPVRFSFAARNLYLWRGTTAAAGAVAAALLLFIVLREFGPLAPSRPIETAEIPPSQQPAQQAAQAAGRFVAVLQRDATAPAFLLTVDIENRKLTVRRVAAEREPGRSYELWLVSDRFPQPRSLGVIGGEEFTVQPTLASYDPETINRATYAVSLEPEGGSPTGVPTGPVLFTGNLVEAAPR